MTGIKKNKPAFTLVEILVVVSVATVLVTLSLFYLNDSRKGSRDLKRVSDINQIQTALEAFYYHQGRYPTAEEFNTSSLAYGDVIYLKEIPTSPKADGDCSDEENTYSYSEDGINNGSYALSFCLGGVSENLTAGPKIATPEAWFSTASSGPSEELLSISKSGTGSGTVSSSPSGIDCGSTCFYSYEQDTSVTLSASSSVGSTFSGWSGACSGTGSCEVSMTEPKSATASFTINNYALSVSKSGAGSGTVSSSPSGIDCGASCSGDFDYGTSVTLSAVAPVGSVFTGWSGEGCSGTGTCVISVTEAKSVSANFDISYCSLDISNVVFEDFFTGSTLDTDKWTEIGASFGSISVADGYLNIVNQTGGSSSFIGAATKDFRLQVGQIIETRVKNTSGRHSAVIAFGQANWYPYPHGGSIGASLYSRADAKTATISLRRANNTTSSGSPTIQDYTDFRVLKMFRLTQDLIEFYADGTKVGQFTDAGLSAGYAVYYSYDGHTKPNTAVIDYLLVFSEGGTVSPVVSEDRVCGTEVTLTAAPSTGYVFVSWTDEGDNVLSTNNPYSFNLSTNQTIKANFSDTSPPPPDDDPPGPQPI